MEMTVSVVVATYRRDRELYNALTSLTAQTYPKVEILVVDDNADPVWNGRVRSVVEQVRQESAKDIICLVNETNQGSAESRNIGIRAATGDYITFLDDDDVYLPEKIEKQLSDMTAGEGDFGLTDLYLYDEAEHMVDRRERTYLTDMTQDALVRCHILYHMTGTDTLMFRSDYLRQIGGFPGIDIGDEFYLMLQAILGGGKCVYSPHCLVKAYIHTGEGGGLSSGQKKIDGENALHAEKKKYFRYLTKADIRYVEVRHRAVISFAQLRMKHYGACVAAMAGAFCISPIQCVKLVLQHQ